MKHSRSFIVIACVGIFGVFIWTVTTIKLPKTALAPPDSVAVQKNLHSDKEDAAVEVNTPAVQHKVLAVASSEVLAHPAPLVISTSSESQALPERYVMQNVLFTSQAPSRQWSDDIYQNACEEASMIMAHAWMTGQTILYQKETEKNIKKISDLAEETFGKGTLDTSVSDTAKIFSYFFSPHTLEVRKNISLEGIKQEIFAGNLIIAPADGKKLNNPHFSGSGPEYHMLVIIGYDPKTSEFITNDPGTQFGKEYRYRDHVLYGSVRDYPTGNHEPVGQVQKNILIVKRNTAH